MRNFGAFIVSLSRWYVRDAMEILVEYSSPNLVELHLDDYTFTDELALTMRPLFGHLHKLTISRCSLGESFWRLLPLWALQLEELEIRHFYSQSCGEITLGFDGLHQPIRKLKKISFFSCAFVRNNDIEGILMHNSQLKAIELISCCNLDDGVLQSIAEYIPTVECLRIDQPRITNCHYFGQLSHLKSLHLTFDDCDSSIVSIVHEMNAAKISLEYFYLRSSKIIHKTDEFIAEISKWKTLKTLKLIRVNGLTATHVIDICKHLSELIELELKLGNHTAGNMVNLLRNTSKLQSLKLTKINLAEKLVLDVDSYTRIADILKKRDNRYCLKIRLHRYGYVANIPIDLARAHKDLLSIEVFHY